MASKVIMPRLTYEMREARITTWLKQEGDHVAPGDGLFEVETDKASVTVEAEATGVLRSVRFKAGEVVPIGEVLAYVAEAGEEVPAVEVAPVGAMSTSSPAPATEPAMTSKTAAPPTIAIVGGERILASPIARRLALQHGVDLSQLAGSGIGGRIQEADVRAAIARREAPLPQPPDGMKPAYRDVELSRLQRVTAERMAEAQRTVPQFVLEVEVDMGAAGVLRDCFAEQHGYRPSFTSIIGRAVALALREHSEVNSSFVEGRRRVFADVNLGIAMALPDGLLVPVIRQADHLSLPELNARLEELMKRARANALRAEDLAEGTFTLSNLGMLGVDGFQAVVNPPQAAILAVGRIREQVIAREGMIGVRPVATMRLTCDHRVLDGATAARFLGRIRGLLERADALS